MIKKMRDRLVDREWGVTLGRIEGQGDHDINILYEILKKNSKN